MICGDSSHTKDDCPVKETSEKFKCANCGGNHNSIVPLGKKIWTLAQNERNNINLQRPSSSSPTPVVGNRYTNPVATSCGSGNNFLPTNSSNSRTYANVLVGNQRTTQAQNYPTPLITPSVPSPQVRPRGNNSSNPDLGNITPYSMMGMISAMLNCNSMSEAIQYSLKFTNEIVMKLKFSNEFN